MNALTVTTDGWLAWGWTLTYDDGHVLPQIRKLKPGGDDIGLKLKPLDSGPAVDPASLTRSGHSIQWTHADEQRSSELA